MRNRGKARQNKTRQNKSSQARAGHGHALLQNPPRRPSQVTICSISNNTAFVMALCTTLVDLSQSRRGFYNAGSIILYYITIYYMTVSKRARSIFFYSEGPRLSARFNPTELWARAAVPAKDGTGQREGRAKRPSVLSVAEAVGRAVERKLRAAVCCGWRCKGK